MGNEHSGDVENLVQAGVVQGGVHVNHYASAPTPPKPPEQLPADLPIFVDREPEQRILHDVLRRENGNAHAACVFISGLRGMGKSALATRWVRSVLDRFTDGQIYFDFQAQHRPVGLHDAVEHCLCALGVPGDQLPGSLNQALGQLRTLTSGRKQVLVFDNVDEPHALLDLRPASADSLVLLIGDRNAGELVSEGVVPIELDKLDTEYAVRLLAEICDDDRVDADPQAARELVELCGGLPIAVRLVAGRLQRRPKKSLARAVAELSDERHRLDRLTDRSGPVVRRALDFAVDGLDESLRNLYRLLALVPGPSFSVDAVSALAELPVPEVEELLYDLSAANLLRCDDREQFGFHSLVRLHARTFAEGAAEDGKAALRRLADWYRRQGAFADRAVMGPNRLRVSGDDELVAAPNPFDHDRALEWLEGELANLLALVEESNEHGWHRVVISLCDSPLWTLHNQHKHYDSTLHALGLAVTAAHAEEDLVAECRMRTLRVRLLMETREFEQAHAEAARAREVAELSGHRRVSASASEFHGRVHLEQGAWNEAIDLFEQARAINDELGKPRGMGLQEHFIGQALDGRGDHEQALSYLLPALDRFAEFPEDRRTPDRIRTSLGRVYQHLGRHDAAIEALRSAEAGVRARQASFDLAAPLELLVVSLAATGNPAAAEACLREALAIYEQAHSPDADRIRRML